MQASSIAILLCGYWRSLATFRVRAALNLKGLDDTETLVDLSRGEQFSEPFHRVNPQHVLPAFDHDGLLLTQSLPIIEYIDETWADEPLLPADASGRAQSGQVQRQRRVAIGERRRGRIDV